MEDEIWLPIKDFPDYEISSYGKVRRATDRTHGRNPNYVIAMYTKGTILKPEYDRYGYLKINLFKDKKVFPNKIHVLVCEAFNGKKPEGNYEVAHWDDIKDNNYYKNLRWATPKQNWADRKRNSA